MANVSLTRRSGYWQVSRAPRYSLTFALPLLVLYEVLALVVNQDALLGIRNAADVILKSLFVALAGTRGPVIFGAVLVAGAGWLVLRDLRRHPGLKGPVFVGMLAESAVLALLFGIVVGMLTAQLLSVFPLAAGGTVAPGTLGPGTMAPGTMTAGTMTAGTMTAGTVAAGTVAAGTVAAGTVAAGMAAPLPAVHLLAAGPFGDGGFLTGLMISLGAGLYEELLFRVILVGALLWIARRWMGMGPVAAGTLAVVAGALIFSAFHYVGPYGDALEVGSFTFRTIAGLAFSGLYVTRGFGITAWTHALYDVFLLVAIGR